FIRPGRVEIRAKLPEDNISVVRIQASYDSSQENFINLLALQMNIYQSFQMQSDLKFMCISKSILSLTKNGFNVIGFEWTYSGMQFFLNVQYSEEIAFGKSDAFMYLRIFLRMQYIWTTV